MSGHALQRGSVLIVVLLVSLGLVSITLLFGHSMLMTYRGADNDLAGRQADQAVEGAARYAEYLLINEETPGALPDVTTYASEAVPVGDARFWFIGRPTEAEAGTEPVFGLVDEASKLNVNTATQAMLEGLPGMTAELAAAIIDWRDTNDEVTAGGAESETYLLRQPSYACKNAPFESVEELALVGDVDPLILYGEDANMNGVLDAGEDDSDVSAPEDNADGHLDPGVFEYVTVYSREANKRSDGSARVNISQSSEELRKLMTDSFGEARGEEILQRVGPTPAPRSPLEFFVRAGMTTDEFDKIADALTVTTGDYVTGLVNVNTAGEVVLACLPGIGTERAADVVNARLNRAEQGTDIAWVAEVLGPENAVLAGPYLTGRSEQISADVAAVGRLGRGYRRTRFIIDVSTGEPQIIHRRNLAPLGWALGTAVRDDLAMLKEAK